jgi:KDEL-tailed cysteine endopeptidase
MVFQRVLALYYSAFSLPSYPSFTHWASYYGKVYTPTERDYRNYIFNTNVERIYYHNTMSNSSWTMSVNKFADMTSTEWRSKYVSGFLNVSKKRSPYSYANLSVKALPTSVDWTEHGAVTPVKDQGQCGSCWAFSSTGSLEGAWFLKNGSLYNVSEQQLVDCSTAQGNQGCNGGLMDDAFQYVIDAKGLTTDSAYPYTATGPNKCVAKGKPVVVTAVGFKDVVPNSETALLSAIAQQPVSVAVEADQDSFQFYSSGVMTKACGTQLDHGVLAVGYGTDTTGQDYYKVKNSWGADWGLDGYILLGRGSSFGAAGQCGIQMAASYPVV